RKDRWSRILPQEDERPHRGLSRDRTRTAFTVSDCLQLVEQAARWKVSFDENRCYQSSVGQRQIEPSVSSRIFREEELAVNLVSTKWTNSIAVGNAHGLEGASFSRP